MAKQNYFLQQQFYLQHQQNYQRQLSDVRRIVYSSTPESSEATQDNTNYPTLGQKRSALESYLQLENNRVLPPRPYRPTSLHDVIDDQACFLLGFRCSDIQTALKLPEETELQRMNKLISLYKLSSDWDIHNRHTHRFDLSIIQDLAFSLGYHSSYSKRHKFYDNLRKGESLSQNHLHNKEEIHDFIRRLDAIIEDRIGLVNIDHANLAGIQINNMYLKRYLILSSIN